MPAHDDATLKYVDALGVQLAASIALNAMQKCEQAMIRSGNWPSVAFRFVKMKYLHQAGFYTEAGKVAEEIIPELSDLGNTPTVDSQAIKLIEAHRYAAISIIMDAAHEARELLSPAHHMATKVQKHYLATLKVLRSNTNRKDLAINLLLKIEHMWGLHIFRGGPIVPPKIPKSPVETSSSTSKPKWFALPTGISSFIEKLPALGESGPLIVMPPDTVPRTFFDTAVRHHLPILFRAGMPGTNSRPAFRKWSSSSFSDSSEYGNLPVSVSTVAYSHHFGKDSTKLSLSEFVASWSKLKLPSSGLLSELPPRHYVFEKLEDSS